MQQDIEIGEYRLVSDFEHGVRPVQVVKKDKREGYYWCRYSDGSVYDFHASELKPLP